MSYAARILAALRGQSTAPRSERREPQLPRELYMIPDRGPMPQPVAVKVQR